MQYAENSSEIVGRGRKRSVSTDSGTNLSRRFYHKKSLGTLVTARATVPPSDADVVSHGTRCQF